jgi:hypothetical protein
MCHECARQSIATPGLGQCRFCLVSLCKDHLVESLQSDVVPRYACDHRPELPFDREPTQKVGRPSRVRRPTRALRAYSGA